MVNSTMALETLIERGQSHVAQATLDALTGVQKALRDTDVAGEDQLALLLHTATVYAVESLHLVIRSLGEGSPADHEAALRELLVQVCRDRAGSLKLAS